MDYFKQQDTFIAKMKDDYEKGLINIKALAPYFRWKFDDKAKSPSKSQIGEMRDAIQEELDGYYEAYPKGYRKQLMNRFGGNMLDMVTISISLLTWRQSTKNFLTY